MAHGAEPAAGQPAVGGGEAEMLRRPHLMLANLGGDDRVAAARRLEQRLDRALRHDIGVGFLLPREVEAAGRAPARSEEHTSEHQSLMRHSYAVFFLKNKNTTTNKDI